MLALMSTTFMHPGRLLKRGVLVRRLAEGASPVASPELSERAQQLTSARHRRGLACSVDNLIDAAEEPPRPYSSAVPLRRREILAARTQIAALARDLRDTAVPVSARGVALVEQLLRHGDSPLYWPSPDQTVEGAVRHARSALLLD